jgi:hypothetical protein
MTLETRFIRSSFTHTFRACQGTFVPQNFFKCISAGSEPQILVDLARLIVFSRVCRSARRRSQKDATTLFGDYVRGILPIPIAVNGNWPIGPRSVVFADSHGRAVTAGATSVIANKTRGLQSNATVCG